MDVSSKPLIVGAGPVGLAAALFLARDGVPVRIIDAAVSRSKYSRALAVNPRTLDILEPTGVTEQMLAAGQPIRGGRFARGRETLAQLSFDELPVNYRFLLGLSQNASERLLEQALNRHGVRVERGVRMLHCRNAGDHVLADLADNAAPPKTVQFPWLLAADGAHSVARNDLGIAFEGSTFDQPWHLLDVPLDTSLAEDSAHVIFREGGGFLFLIRVIGDANPSSAAGPLWRVISDDPDPLARLQTGKATGPAVWESSFHISHRVTARLREGNVFFAGDSAHVHSPIGARGMNLGIEDAWVFSQLHRAGQLDRYDKLRHKTDRRVVKRIELLSRLAIGESTASRLLRRTALPLMMRVPPTRDRIIQTVTGLDHPLPRVP